MFFILLGLMDETAQIGEVLEAIYSDEEEFKALFSKLSAKMVKNEKLAEKNRKILTAIRDQVGDLKQCQKQMIDYAKKREEYRIYYDHYRTKVEGLKKKEMKKQNEPVASGDMNWFKQDKSYLVKNQGKFENA